MSSKTSARQMPTQTQIYSIRRPMLSCTQMSTIMPTIRVYTRLPVTRMWTRVVNTTTREAVEVMTSEVMTSDSPTIWSQRITATHRWANRTTQTPAVSSPTTPTPHTFRPLLAHHSRRYCRAPPRPSTPPPPSAVPTDPCLPTRGPTSTPPSSIPVPITRCHRFPDLISI